MTPLSGVPIRSSLCLAALLALCPVALAGGSPEAREFADAKRRADLQLSLQQKECERLAADLKEACLKRLQDAHDETIEAARLLYLGVEATSAGTDDTDAADTPGAQCERLPARERSACMMDMQRRHPR